MPYSIQEIRHVLGIETAYQMVTQVRDSLTVLSEMWWQTCTNDLLMEIYLTSQYSSQYVDIQAGSLSTLF